MSARSRPSRTIASAGGRLAVGRPEDLSRMNSILVEVVHDGGKTATDAVELIWRKREVINCLQQRRARLFVSERYFANGTKILRSKRKIGVNADKWA